MSAETSVPRPRESDVDISDSALLKGLLSEAEFAFAFFDVTAASSGSTTSSPTSSVSRPSGWSAAPPRRR